MTLAISQIGPEFADWDELLALILASFASMNGVIDPPSSALRLTADALREKAAREAGFAAWEGRRLVGCVFIDERADHVYVGKLAVAPERQGSGLGLALLAAAEAFACARGKPAIELQTRVELVANHRFFARMGFRETARTAHPGYDRPTSITMRKELGA